MSRHYSRLDEPETDQNPADYFNRFSQLSSPPPDLAIHTVSSPDYDLRTSTTDNIPLTGTTRHESLTSLEPVAPYRDYVEDPITRDRRNSRRSSYKSLNSLKHYSSSILLRARDSVSSFNVPSVASPWEHGKIEEADALISHTTREFNHRVQRRRLFVNSTFQFLITLVLCAGLAGTLIGYHNVWALSVKQRHMFNTLVTFLSICLGINLASSFRGYAQMMRWRLLASKYRSLQEFELVMGCESQMKVIRLFWTARTRGYYFLNLTQLLCVVWILINTLLQVLVAMVGLTYSIDQSSNHLGNQWGTVSVVDLSVIYDPAGAVSEPTWYEQQAVANLYVQEGVDYSLDINPNYPNPPDQVQSQAVYTDYYETTVQYFFGLENASPDMSSIVESTSRQVQSFATCNAYKVVHPPNDSTNNVTYIDPDTGAKIQFWIENWSSGAITYASNNNSDCGPRCITMAIYQAPDNDKIINPGFFVCNSTVEEVTGTPIGTLDAAVYQMPDQQARLMAGAIGWTGFWYDFTPWQYQLYSQNTYWSPTNEVGAEELADKLMEASMFGVAAMDDHGPRVNVTGWAPTIAQTVDVEWRWSWLLLGAIPLVQFLALVCIIAWANKAIIKDDSYLATAKLLKPIVEKLGPKGCLLTGDEIAEELSNVRVAYGYRNPEGYSERDKGIVRHVDILEEHEGFGVQRSMPMGRYDGEVAAEKGGNDDDRFLGMRRQAAFKRRLSL